MRTVKSASPLAASLVAFVIVYFAGREGSAVQWVGQVLSGLQTENEWFKRGGFDQGRLVFSGLKSLGGPVSPSTLPATSRPYIESSVVWKSRCVPCTLPV